MAKSLMSHTFAVKIRVFKHASHKIHLIYWTQIFWHNLSFKALSLFTADHLIAQQETKARMLMKQNVNSDVTKDSPIHSSMCLFKRLSCDNQVNPKDLFLYTKIKRNWFQILQTNRKILSTLQTHSMLIKPYGPRKSTNKLSSIFQTIWGLYKKL